MNVIEQQEILFILKLGGSPNVDDFKFIEVVELLLKHEYVCRNAYSYKHEYNAIKNFSIVVDEQDTVFKIGDAIAFMEIEHGVATVTFM